MSSVHRRTIGNELEENLWNAYILVLVFIVIISQPWVYILPYLCPRCKTLSNHDEVGMREIGERSRWGWTNRFVELKYRCKKCGHRWTVKERQWEDPSPSQWSHGLQLLSCFRCPQGQQTSHLVCQSEEMRSVSMRCRSVSSCAARCEPGTCRGVIWKKVTGFLSTLKPPSAGLSCGCLPPRQPGKRSRQAARG